MTSKKINSGWYQIDTKHGIIDILNIKEYVEGNLVWQVTLNDSENQFLDLFEKDAWGTLGSSLFFSKKDAIEQIQILI